MNNKEKPRLATNDTIPSTTKGKGLHDDAQKRVTTQHPAVDETDGQGFSPEVLVRTVPTTAPRRVTTPAGIAVVSVKTRGFRPDRLHARPLSNCSLPPSLGEGIRPQSSWQSLSGRCSRAEQAPDKARSGPRGQIKPNQTQIRPATVLLRPNRSCRPLIGLRHPESLHHRAMPAAMLSRRVHGRLCHCISYHEPTLAEPRADIGEHHRHVARGQTTPSSTPRCCR